LFATKPGPPEPHPEHSDQRSKVPHHNHPQQPDLIQKMRRELLVPSLSVSNRPKAVSILVFPNAPVPLASVRPVSNLELDQPMKPHLHAS
jgi:hypothetical protein